MNAWKPGQRAMVEVEVEEVWPAGDLLIRLDGAHLVVPAADLLPVPAADDDTIERAALVLAEHMWSASDDELCSCGWTPDDYWQYDDGRRFVADALSNAEEGDEPDVWAPIVQAFTEHQATALLASPVREPGRSEAEAFELRGADSQALCDSNAEPGRSEAETLTTIEELDALLPESVVLDRDGDAWQKWATGGWTCAVPAENTLDQPASSLVWILGPLTLIHRAVQVTGTEGGE